MIGIVAMPKVPNKAGVIIAVGGPQYRAGSHRQFVLLSRVLAEAGYPCMRFDYRGMGDSTGEMRSFEAVNDDFCAAIGAFQANCPTVEHVVLWGLCDAASACLLYWNSMHDQRVDGLVLLNPWVRSEASLARTHIKHYYIQRLLQPEFWLKLLQGQLGVGQAIAGFLSSLRQAGRVGGINGSQTQLSFQERILCGLQKFHGETLVILSENDYTAKEFIENTRVSPAWQATLSGTNVVVREVSGADHTFSTSEWRATVETLTVGWLLGKISA